MWVIKILDPPLLIAYNSYPSISENRHRLPRCNARHSSWDHRCMPVACNRSRGQNNCRSRRALDYSLCHQIQDCTNIDLEPCIVHEQETYSHLRCYKMLQKDTSAYYVIRLGYYHPNQLILCWILYTTVYLANSDLRSHRIRSYRRRTRGHMCCCLGNTHIPLTKFNLYMPRRSSQISVL